MSGALTVGVLAVQGAFAEHREALRRAGAKAREIRGPRELNGIDALILPGGESTAQGRLLRELGLFEPVAAMIGDGLPVFGTCAGMILLAKNIENDARRHFAAMDITVRRNGYGRQLASFVARGRFAQYEDVEMVCSTRMSRWSSYARRTSLRRGRTLRFSPKSTGAPSPRARGVCSPRPSTPR